MSYLRKSFNKSNEDLSSNECTHYPKDSFDRFGDDLSEVILSYLTFEDRFAFECVSKQFRRLVFNTQTELKLNCRSFNRRIPDPYVKFNISWIETILDKCPYIKSIHLYRKLATLKDSERIQFYHLIETKLKFLNKIIFYFKPVDNISMDFLTNVGTKLKDIYINSDGYQNGWKRSIFKMCPNLDYVYADNFDLIFDDKQLLLKKLKSFSLGYKSKDIELLEIFVDNYKNTLKSISIGIQERLTKELFQQLLKLEQLTQLNIYYSRYYFDLNQSFVDYFRNMTTTLKKIDLKIYLEEDLYFQQIYDSINRFKQLKSLKIKTTDLGNIVKIREPPKECTDLRHLSFDFSFLLSDDFFDSFDKYFPRLQSIDLKNADLTDKILMCLSNLNLKSVYFSKWMTENLITESVLLGYIRHSKHLESLHVNNCLIRIFIPRSEHLISIRCGIIPNCSDTYWTSFSNGSEKLFPTLSKMKKNL